MILNVNGLTKEQISLLESQCDKYKAENAKTKFQIDYTNGYVATSPTYTSGLTSNITDKTQIDTLGLLGLYRDTKVDLDKVLTKIKIHEQLRRWSLLCSDKIDWTNGDQLKFYICKVYQGVNTHVEIVYSQVNAGNHIYFTDKDVLVRAIQSIGEQNLFDNYFIQL